MRIHPISLITGLIFAMAISSCGEDRTGEYYALISTKTWMYETMQENYLFYDELPAEDGLNFFKKPDIFLQSVVAPRDQKNGVIFSHIDSVKISRSISDYPSFGIEGVLVRNAAGNNEVHVLLTYDNSPASDVGIRRGDWIISANGYKITSNNYEQYIQHPSRSWTYQIARKNATGTFDTLSVEMPSPRYVDEPSVYLTKTIQSGNRKAFYIMYNSFNNEEEDQLKEAFNQGMTQSPDDIILDLRYNPGGYVNTALLLGTILAPDNAMGKNFVNLIPNDKFEQTISYTLDPQLLHGVSHASFRNLYIITTESTASASELVINCLKPYLGDRLIQVGEATFGKNVAQSLFTSEEHPLLEFWLTTSYIANSEGYYDYYTTGLEPTYTQVENLAGEIGELGTKEDILLSPILQHMATGNFPEDETDETVEFSRESNHGSSVLLNPLARKQKIARITR